MIGINKLWMTFIAQVNTWQGGFWSPQANFTEAVNDIQNELMNDKVAKWQESQILTDEVSPFLETVNVKLVTNSNRPYDTAILPPNYVHYSSARVIIINDEGCGCKDKKDIDGQTGCIVECSADNKYIDPDTILLEEKHAQDEICEGQVKIIDNQRWAALCDSFTKRPTISKPAITLFAGGIKVYPKHVGIIIMDYFRKPAEAVFNYTLGPNDEIIFDPNGSIDLEWPESVQPEFIARLMKKYAMYTGQEGLYQMGEMERQITNK